MYAPKNRKPERHIQRHIRNCATRHKKQARTASGVPVLLRRCWACMLFGAHGKGGKEVKRKGLRKGSMQRPRIML